jgi:hypothetical protein
MITLLHEQSETTCSTGRASGEDLWIGSQEFAAATGWSLKPEGLCRGDICVPIPSGHATDHVSGDALNAAAFWRRMNQPVVHDAAGEIWMLGASAANRSMALHSLEAPDFALPDLAGKTGTLSEQRGKKVLLATWASW